MQDLVLMVPKIRKPAKPQPPATPEDKKGSKKEQASSSAKKTGGGDADERYFFIPVEDHKKYFNASKDEEIDRMHPKLVNNDGEEWHAVPLSELEDWEAFYDPCEPEVNHAVIEIVSSLRSRTSKRGRGKAVDPINIDDLDNEEPQPKKLKGGAQSVNKTLFNAATNLTRTEINVKKTRRAEEKTLTGSWVKQLWTDHVANMQEKLPVLASQNLPAGQAYVKDNLTQQVSYGNFMGPYLEVWSKFFRLREGEETLAAIEALEAECS